MSEQIFTTQFPVTGSPIIVGHGPGTTSADKRKKGIYSNARVSNEMFSITFYATVDLDRTVRFYRETFDAASWLEQPDCTILRLGNQLIGFCERDHADTAGIITIVTGDREGVDRYYDQLADRAEGPPSRNDHYEIYHFYLSDPDGRSVEVQTFLHELPPIP